ncbi:hypothetical protein HOY82DRAFT_98618 [Tuber indicum]|nr:hypothetical protein HOY82DRAFT_98618 [Tuber indicum]
MQMQGKRGSSLRGYCRYSGIIWAVGSPSRLGLSFLSLFNSSQFYSIVYFLAFPDCAGFPSPFVLSSWCQCRRS